MRIVVGASGSRLYTSQTTWGIKDRVANNLLHRKGDAPLNYVDLTECGARPSRWTTMLKQWREENQSLM
eukprot:4245293-Lingulodinium_polyedra.AAC.1